MDHIWLRESEEKYNVPDNKHDKGYKYLLSVKKVFLELLRCFVKQGWTDKIDESNLVKVDKSFILQDFKDKEADLVYWVKLNDQDVIFYLLLEIQSTVDFQMPYRLLVYMVEIWREILKDLADGQEKLKEFRLPSIIPLVLYNGKNNWTACSSYKEYLSGYEIFGDNIIDFRYILIDVNRYNEKELLEMSNLIASAFLIDRKQDIESLFKNLKKVMRVLKEISPNEFELFKNWFKNIILRGIEPEGYNKLDSIIEESREVEVMVYNLELTLKEEFEKNRNEGRLEGKIEGRNEGRIEGKKEAIIELLQEMSEVPEKLKNVIQTQNNMGTLIKWIKLAARVSSIEEFKNIISN
jgi:predicted transposase YdaD